MTTYYLNIELVPSWEKEDKGITECIKYNHISAIMLVSSSAL